MTRAAGRATARRTSPHPAGTIGRLKAQMIARYRLASVPGRPEELRQPGSDRGVSIQYGCKTIRVRLMEDRGWVACLDLNPEEPTTQLWHRLHPVLDPWFGCCKECQRPIGTHRLDCSAREV